MTNSPREELLHALRELGERNPAMRLGQLLLLLCTLAGEDAPRAVYDVEDEELLAAARRHLEAGATHA